ncbi:DUF6893 family small protein [Kitasatospora acidiphila]|nr:hypothetical protein [Kitasatospora sp. GP30]
MTKCVFKALVVAGLAWAAVQLAPDVKRYLRIRAM